MPRPRSKQEINHFLATVIMGWHRDRDHYFSDEESIWDVCEPWNPVEDFSQAILVARLTAKALHCDLELTFTNTPDSDELSAVEFISPDLTVIGQQFREENSAFAISDATVCVLYYWSYDYSYDQTPPTAAS